MPATETTSERDFSIAGRILEEHRTQLSEENVDDLLFVHGLKRKSSKSNVLQCVNSLKPLFVIFQIPFSKNNLKMQNIENAIELFPPKAKLDANSLQGEIEILFKFCLKALAS